MPSKMFFCFMSLLLFSSPSFAEKVWTSFTPSDAVYDIAVQGNYVWCATANGPVRWDKRDMSYRIYRGLYDNRVSRVEVDSNANVWFGSPTKIHRWNGSSWERFSTDNGLPYDGISALALGADGCIWAGVYQPSMYYDCPKSIVRYTGNTWEKKLFVKYGSDWDKLHISPVRSIISFSPDDVWAIVEEQLWHDDGTGWKTVIPGENVPLSKASFMVADSASRLWIANRNQIFRFDSGTWTEMYSSGTKEITALATGPKGEIIASERVASSSGKVSVLIYTGTAWDILPFGDGENFTIKTLCYDSDGVIWAGTNDGLSRHDSHGWARFVLPNRMPYGEINSLSVQASGDIWAGSEYGVLRFNGHTWKKYSKADGLPDSSITTLTVTPNDDVWFVTNLGMARFDGKSEKIMQTNTGLLPTTRIQSICLDSSGNPWIGTESEIFRLQGEQWAHHDLGNVPVKSFGTWTVDKSGNVWIGFFLNHWTIWSAIREISWVETTPLWYDLGSQFIIPRPDDAFWVGVNVNSGSTHSPNWTGILYLVTANSAKKITLAEGKISTPVVVFGDDLWFGMREYNSSDMGPLGGGLKWYNQKTMGGKQYISGDGILSNAITSLTVTPDGSVWAGCSLGLTRYGEPLDDETIITSVSGDRPAALSLLHNRPNPFNPSTTISFVLPVAGKATLVIYDITGRKVRELVRGPLTAGTHVVSWDGKDDAGQAVSSGVYLSRLSAGAWTATGKMLLMK